VSVKIRAYQPPNFVGVALLFVLVPLFGLAILYSGPMPYDKRLGGTLVMLILEAGALVYAYMASWSLFGFELLSIHDGRLIVERHLFRRTLSTREYDLAGIENPRLDTMSDGRLMWKFALGSPFERSGFGVGPVLFDYHDAEVRLAEGIRKDPGAAQRLLDMLLEAQAKWVATGVNGEAPCRTSAST
jgi:hypothetical protein